MKKMCVLLVTALVSAVIMAEPSQSKKNDALVKKLGGKNFLLLRAGGGKIEKPGTQKGQIVFVNAQKTVSKDWLQDGVDQLKRDTRFKVDIKDGEFDIKKPKLSGNVSIFVVDDEFLPMTLVAAESKWAVLNVRQLKSDKEAFYKARVKKAVARVFAMLCGGMSSGYSVSLVGHVTKASDLDQFPNAQIPFDVLNRMNPYMERFGVLPAQVSTYRKACVEGWAPPPANDVQKIIYTEVNSKPTEPIKIKFDPKKGE